MIAGTVFGAVGNSPDTGRMGFGRYVGASTSSKVKTVVADADKMSVAGPLIEHDPYGPEVKAFIAKFGLTEFMPKALAEVGRFFGHAVKPKFEVFRDPSDGSATLYVEIPVTDFGVGDVAMSDFSYDWWYDRIADYGHLVGFRIVEDLGD